MKVIMQPEFIIGLSNVYWVLEFNSMGDETWLQQQNTEMKEQTKTMDA